VASLAKRTIILAICRLLNSAILFLSPVFLVRLLDVTAYGQYREFLLYAYLCTNLIGFGIQRNLLYFIPRHPEQEKQAVTNTALSLLVVTLLGCGIVYFGRGIVFAKVSFDFAIPLVLFVFSFLNLDLFESYWLANKRSDYVLYFSVVYLTLRVGVSVLVAWLTTSVMLVIWALVAVEISKLLFMLVFVSCRRLITCQIDTHLWREQFRFFVPLGLAAAMLYLNRQVGALCVSTLFGVEALAVYLIGGVNMPVVTVVRSATTDVIFPEMAERGKHDLRQGLDIWRRANVLYVFLIFPLFILLLYYSSLVVETLFTPEYAGAVPIFQVYLLFLMRQSVELAAPLRAANANRYFVYGNIMSSVFNIGLLLVLIQRVGMIGAAIAFVASDVALGCYVTNRTLKVYEIRLPDLFYWRRMGLVVLLGIVCVPVLLLGDLLRIPSLVRALLTGTVYLVVYVACMSRCRIEEVDILLGKAKYTVQRLMPRFIQTHG